MPILDSMDTLVDEVYQLCQRMTPIENHRIVTEPLSTLEYQRKQLEAQVEAALDPIAKKAYEGACRAIALRMEQQTRTDAQLSQVEAYLAGLINELNAILGHVIPMQAMRGETIREKASSVVSQIQQEITEVRAFQPR